MSVEQVTLLLGRRDEPTDGVVDYCENLRQAGAQHGLSFELARVDWAEKGWRSALADLSKAAAAWRDRWVLLQFTTLAWSRRGFPLRAPRVLDVLRRCGARPAVVCHDFSPLSGKGIVGNAREYCQLRVLRRLYACSDLCIFTVPVNKVSWLPLRRDKATFIPVGANVPNVEHNAKPEGGPQQDVLTVAVFGITGGARGSQEARDIAYVLRCVSSKGIRLRLMTLGRGAADFHGALREAFSGSGIELSLLGLMPAEDLAWSLAGANVLLCVRGYVSSRRGSVIAGIACGLPIIGYRGTETGFPITEAGVVLVSEGDREGLVQALSDVLTDKKLYDDLRERSLAATRQYLSWDSIAAQFARALTDQHAASLPLGATSR